MRVLLIVAVAALASSASADFVGLDGSSAKLVRDGQTFYVMDVYANFSETSDRMILVWNTEIHLNAAPNGTFYHAPLPGGVQTAHALCYPEWGELGDVDTYFCLGGDQCATSGVQWVTPDLPSNVLVNTGHASTTGGWFNVPPWVAEDGAGDDYRVRLCRLSIRAQDWVPNAFVACSWTVAWKSMEDCVLHFTDAALTSMPFDETSTELPDDVPGLELLVNCPGGDGGGGGGGGESDAPPAPIGPIGASLAWCSPNGYLTGWFMNGFEYVSANCVEEQLADACLPVGKGDADNDGDLDYFFYNSSTCLAWVYLMDQGFVSDKKLIGGPPIFPLNEAKIIGVGDVNGDSKVDLLWRHDGSGELGEVYVYILDGGDVVEVKMLGVSMGFQLFAVGDFNKDGTIDIVWRLANGLLMNWALHGTNAPSVSLFGGVATIPASWKGVTACDLDADGDDDIILRNPATGQIKAWKVENFARVDAAVIGNLGTNWKFATSADLDGDGDADLVWRNKSTGYVNGWEMQGLQKLSGGTIGTTTNGAWKAW